MNDAKTRRILLPAVARTATTVCLAQKDASQQFARVYLNVTVAGASLKVFFRGYDVPGGTPAVLNTGGAGVTAIGMSVFELMPNGAVAAGDVKETVGRILPCIWDIQVQHADATTTTYSLTCEVFPVG
jgi:hypothetical protein